MKTLEEIKEQKAREFYVKSVRQGFICTGHEFRAGFDAGVEAERERLWKVKNGVSYCALCGSRHVYMEKGE